MKLAIKHRPPKSRPIWSTGHRGKRGRGSRLPTKVSPLAGDPLRLTAPRPDGSRALGLNPPGQRAGGAGGRENRTEKSALTAQDARERLAAVTAQGRRAREPRLPLVRPQ